MPRHACPLDDPRLLAAAGAGLLPLNFGGELTWIVAPRHLAARTLTRLLSRTPWLARRIRLASTAELTRFVARHADAALGAKADRELLTRWPQFSAAPRRWRLPVWVAAAAIALLAGLYVFPGETRTAIEAGAAFAFLAWLMLRLTGSFLAPPLVRPARISERGLPVYTIIVALYREAAAVEGLVKALQEISYPA